MKIFFGTLPACCLEISHKSGLTILYENLKKNQNMLYDWVTFFGFLWGGKIQKMKSISKEGGTSAFSHIPLCPQFKICGSAFTLILKQQHCT